MHRHFKRQPLLSQSHFAFVSVSRQFHRTLHIGILDKSPADYIRCISMPFDEQTSIHLSRDRVNFI